jgi:hypothetical protein
MAVIEAHDQQCLHVSNPFIIIAKDVILRSYRRDRLHPSSLAASQTADLPSTRPMVRRSLRPRKVRHYNARGRNASPDLYHTKLFAKLAPEFIHWKDTPKHNEVAKQLRPR